MLVYNPAVQNHTKLVARIFLLVLPAVFLLPILLQTVFAKSNTYIITDGNRTTVFVTRETDPAQVLEDAGFDLGAYDMYTTTSGKDASKITVRRGQQVTIQYCGETMHVNSHGETLADLLNRLALPVYSNYVVSLPMSTETFNGMEVTVDDIVQLEQTYTEEIPFSSVSCFDPSLPKGEQKVLIAGKPGQQLVTASVLYANTIEQSRSILSQTVVQQPVAQIVLVGTGESANSNHAAPAIGDGVIVTASGEVLTYSHSDQFQTTAYTHTDAGCDKITATGTFVRVGTVAVDPKVIPYGTRMFIVSNDGAYIYGIATAEDCGGGIKDKHIDLYFPTTDECWAYGVRSATVYFLN